MAYVAFRIVLTDLARVVSVSEGVETLLGYTRQEFLGAKINFRDRVHRDDIALADSLLSANLQNSSGAVNLRLRRSDGRIVCACGQFKKERSRDGVVTLDLQLADACTVKERNDDSLVRSFKSLIQQTADYICVKNRNHVILAASHSLSNLIETGGGRGELVGATDYDHHPEPAADIFYALEERAIAEGRRVNLVHQVELKDGSKRWIDNRKYPINGPDGKIIGVFGIAPEITDKIETREKLRESEELLRLFIEHAPAGLAMFDCQMCFLAVSRRWLQMFSLEGVDVAGRSYYELFPEIPEHWRQEHRRALAGEAVLIPDDSFDRPNGQTQWLRREILPWRKGDSSVGGIIIFSEDITSRKETENRLRLSASVFTGAREGITITDASGTILDVNAAFTRVTGYPREEAVGRNPSILKSGLQSREFYENMWGCLLRDGHWSGEIWNRSKCGDIYPEAITINAIRDDHGKTTHYVALFSDISEIKEHERQLEHIAHFDALTGLPNRALFADRLRQAMGQARRGQRALAVVHFDLDGFKAVNDRYGHSFGDGLLTAIAFRMKRALRDGDTLARLGGDEFAVVMLELDHEDAVDLAMNRLLEAASEEAQVGEVTVRVSASAGVTLYPQVEEVEADVLLRQAGQAMYQAKLAGGNRCCKFDPGQDLIARSRHENLEHVRRGLDEHQFVLYYQPTVNLRTGGVAGVEALIRWHHPDRGLLQPGMFLPAIEDHPLQIDLGDWTIRTALAQLETWKSAGLDLSLSVNVSAIELQQPDFVDRLRAQLVAHPLVKPSDLALEVVETSALQDVMQTSHVLNDCRNIGLSIALDDFGTGYSSLTYLRRLPANILKIDQSFVRDMLEEPENLNILEGVMGLASAFRRDVIVEGVETLEHGLILLQLGCEIAQGYGIARPMPAAELPTWVKTWRPDPRWADVPPVHSSNRPVLYACVEHRAWLSAFEACLQGKRTAPPSLDASHCRVSAWLESEKRSARGTFASIQAIEILHRQLHGLAAQILESQAKGRNPEGLARLQELHFLHDKCLSRLRSFTRVKGIGSTRKGRGAAPARANQVRSRNSKDH